MMEATLLTNLRTAYDRMIEEREGKTLHPWKQAERARFLTMLQAEGKQTLLEIGMGTGRDSLFFQQQGLTVTGTDLSPAMVAHCRQKGLNAQVVDFASLDQCFAPNSFEGIYAINCLLHVPKALLPTILTKIRTLLRPNGLFYWGQYGGIDQEGVWAGDHYEPKRFFARYTDEQFRALAASLFTTEAFSVVPHGGGEGYFHAATLRKD
ncbi:MAG: class I SAM-dependent methyltransferase [Caldilineaceae bacterium]|nr:class I SAM-dependent methyltransferase [Caldilineaceae bacterium]